MISKADNKELEEAINYVEELIEQFYEFPNPKSVEIKDREIGNIETILKELKRLQEENSYLKLKERNRCVGRYGEIEIHELINKTLLEDYIEKDKIREKIEELNKNKDMISGGYAISILEELLEGK